MAKNANETTAVNFLNKLGIQVTEVVQAKAGHFVGQVSSSYNVTRDRVKKLGRAQERGFNKGIGWRTHAIMNKRGDQALVTIKADMRRPNKDRPVTVEIVAVQ